MLSYTTAAFLVSMRFTLPLRLMKSNDIIIPWGSIWVPCTQAVNLLLAIIFMHDKIVFPMQA